MTDIERQYDYQPKWTVLLLYAGFWALCAVAYGSRLFNTWPEKLPLALCWVLCALSVVMLGKAGLLIVARLLLRPRLTFTKASLLVPRSSWSSEELAIDYQAITGLATSGWGGTRFLYMTHTGGKYRIAAMLLPSRSAFDEVCELLTARVRASQQAGRAQD